MKLQQGQVQVQQLQLNQSLLLSMKLLATPLLELSDSIRKEVEENPLLESEEEMQDLHEIALEDSPGFQKEPGSDPHGEESMNGAFREVSEEWREILLQIDCAKESARVRRCARLLLDFLDRRGYLTQDAEKEALDSGMDPRLFQNAKRLLLCIEPKGLGARDLLECLQYQLEPSEVLEKELIASHWSLVLQGDFESIAKKTGASLADVHAAYSRIAQLNPYPLNGISRGREPIYILPEAAVIEENGHLTIRMTHSWVNSLKVVARYDERMDQISAVDRQYIISKKQEARNLVNNIRQRATTMERILRYLVERQRDFFLSPEGELQDLKQKDIAEALLLDESTISRAVHGKYIQCSRGILPLSELFPTVTEKDRGETIRRDPILNAMEALIEEEAPDHPMSDQALADALKKRGWKISRRTVAKYRDQRSIPNNYERKKLYFLKEARKNG
ncbi:MAG: RNA polymerase factor sigma-54 [Peptoniphilaceae bacterium]|nr:RNA polymerase factor sigma-54 [Peptoniphilaceae bacterium]MCI6660127.1 RNA polymerase factor sigma-54 [Peptoniphilaceae bacterium]MDD7433444.1 RNA polymerase factor sigma-54 [Peptoniphilaceae bacterium]MDY3076210.1 RNA polymerase factor sigma-54 [Peptoniphilaceae bacterium]MDY3986475.1 RNA polymerase factor sigma-54 [Peptoniphilaceae bacterium]